MKLLTIKFLETHVLLLTSNRNDSERYTTEAISREGHHFNISWLAGHHPVLDPATLASDANRSLGILLELLRSAKNLPGLLIISSTFSCIKQFQRLDLSIPETRGFEYQISDPIVNAMNKWISWRLSDTVLDMAGGFALFGFGCVSLGIPENRNSIMLPQGLQLFSQEFKGMLLGTVELVVQMTEVGVC
ncbi:hypothetical protein M9H77_32283 [Catharanthus roseus]|uniref:Uncharacterized protein n=1 Tax=Catharanthus roseus TaxID=4058 RepID=A0ACC0A6D2_CATRO|nr:hypothetical protein M9H77_32283 [Catharanthus roseus]